MRFIRTSAIQGKNNLANTHYRSLIIYANWRQVCRCAFGEAKQEPACICCLKILQIAALHVRPFASPETHNNHAMTVQQEEATAGTQSPMKSHGTFKLRCENGLLATHETSRKRCFEGAHSRRWSGLSRGPDWRRAAGPRPGSARWTTCRGGAFGRSWRGPRGHGGGAGGVP